ncbi:DUF6090 family protein [Aestuariivivens sediminis]|uniref:DUF6090 family protein n=1 Tax=Aestuariivivens sediminis TaxID=2913557 RepID=UPI001F57B355|nr:DUF6090 family protein [Aestuariivivens sediminis]
MIKFFRNIRQQLISQNRFSKYLLYAIGEIVLVVVGILIALSINNWNEQRKFLVNEHEFYKKLVTDFTKESEFLKFWTDFTKENHDINYAISKKIKGKFNNDSLISYNYLQFTIGYRPKINDIYQESFNHISNKNIRDLMTRYRLRGGFIISAIEEYNDYKTGFTRPFLERNGLYNFENVFDDEQNIHNQLHSFEIINSHKLEEHYISDEFKSILVALKLHLSYLINNFQQMDELNNEIIMALEHEIRKE